MSRLQQKETHNKLQCNIQTRVFECLLAVPQQHDCLISLQFTRNRYKIKCMPRAGRYPCDSASTRWQSKSTPSNGRWRTCCRGGRVTGHLSAKLKAFVCESAGEITLPKVMWQFCTCRIVFCTWRILFCTWRILFCTWRIFVCILHMFLYSNYIFL